MNSVSDWKTSLKVLEITNTQLETLWNEVSERETRPAFITHWDNRRKVSERDATYLQERGVTCDQIASKLRDLIDRANTFHQSVPALTEVILDAQFLVQGMDLRAKMIDDCIICPFQLPGPRKITIQNVGTRESICFFETTLHLMENHGYFALPKTDWRIDPKTACNVLNLGKV